MVFILVDDLGWGDVGFLRSKDDDNKPREIQTPMMDSLAQNSGIILNRHYVHSSCTGTRSALQSGRLPVHVQTTLKNPEDPSSGMPYKMTGLAEHMKQAAYRTHYVGKWDVGMATPKHTPYGRGYETSLNYFEHKNDYWTQECAQSICCKPESSTENNNARSADYAHDEYQNLSITDLWDTNEPARDLNGTDYEEFLFLRRMLHILDEHNHSEPLFLFYAPHVAHCPLQVPQQYLDQFDFISDDETQCKVQTRNILKPGDKQPPYSCRKQYHSMVKLLDDILKTLVEKLKETGLWDNTLLVFTSDNGGPTHLVESGATNFDLRGGKYSDWEGGVRAAAFVSGGYLPRDRLGTILQQPLHICDWYKTLPMLAGVNVDRNLEEDSANDVPPIDALNVWPLLVGQVELSPRQEIPLSHHSLISGDYKLIWKDEVKASGWTGSLSPNASSVDDTTNLNCSQGCLFQVSLDRGEHFDLASKQPQRVQVMKDRLVELRNDFFENKDIGHDSCPPDIGEMPCACWMAVNYYGGFFGPYQGMDIDWKQFYDNDDPNRIEKMTKE